MVCIIACPIEATFTPAFFEYLVHRYTLCQLLVTSGHCRESKLHGDVSITLMSSLQQPVQVSHLLLYGVLFSPVIPLTVVVLLHHSCCCSESDYIWLTINLGLNYPLSKVFLKFCLHVHIAVSFKISICQFWFMRLLVVICSSSLSSRQLATSKTFSALLSS